MPQPTPKTLDSSRAKAFALALLAMTQFIIVMDASIVTVALPTIGIDLGFAQDDLSWIINAYTLVFGGFLLLGGRLADLFGRRRLFIGGLILFSAASFAGGLATNDVSLVVARAVQGLGAALIAPAALSLLTTVFTEDSERNKALGVWGQSPAPAAPPASCSAASSPKASAGNGSSGSTSPSA